MDSIAWWASIGVLSTAAIIDASTRRIPDWLSLPFLAAAFLTQVMNGGWAGCGKSFAGLTVAALLFAPACSLRFMGMGDLKLALGAGAWIGPEQFVFAFLFSGMIAGLMAAGYAALNRSRGSRSGPPKRTLRLGDRGALSIPYAPAFAIGTLFSFFGK